MLKAMMSVRLDDRFALLIATLANWRPALAPPRATVLVSAVDRPALSAMKKAEDGMLLVPSVRAVAALAK